MREVKDDSWVIVNERGEVWDFFDKNELKKAKILLGQINDKKVFIDKNFENSVWEIKNWLEAIEIGQKFRLKLSLEVQEITEEIFTKTMMGDGLIKMRAFRGDFMLYCLAENWSSTFATQYGKLNRNGEIKYYSKLVVLNDESTWLHNVIK